MGRCQRTKKHGRNLIIGLVAVGGVAALVLAVSGCPRHGHFRDAKRLRKVVQWRVDDLLDDLKATDAQRQQISASVDRIVDDGLKLRGKRGERHAALVAELGKARPDARVLHALVDERIEAARAFGHRTVDELLQAHGLLDDAQRAALLEQLQEHIDAHK